MEVTINPDGEMPTPPPAAAGEPKAKITITPGTMLIEGTQRATLTAVVDGKTIVWTPELSFFESWDIERWMDKKDLGGAGSSRVLAMATVRVIDGDTQAFPGSEVVIRSLVNRLGDRAAKFIWRQYFENYAGEDEAVKN